MPSVPTVPWLTTGSVVDNKAKVNIDWSDGSDSDGELRKVEELASRDPTDVEVEDGMTRFEDFENAVERLSSSIK